MTCFEIILKQSVEKDQVWGAEHFKGKADHCVSPELHNMPHQGNKLICFPMAHLYNPLIIANHITSIIAWENVMLLLNLPLRPLQTDNTIIKQQMHVGTSPALLSFKDIVQYCGYENVTSTITLFLALFDVPKFHLPVRS